MVVTAASSQPVGSARVTLCPVAIVMGDGFIIRYLADPIVKRALREHYADLARMEDVLRDSDLDWTIVRPPRLTSKPVTGRYRTAYGQNLRRGVFVSRADVAHYMLSILDQPETFRRTVGIANWCHGPASRSAYFGVTDLPRPAPGQPGPGRWAPSPDPNGRTGTSASPGRGATAGVPR
jgi:uncharacterized protein YbjT (DUF2867 family)